MARDPTTPSPINSRQREVKSGSVCSYRRWAEMKEKKSQEIVGGTVVHLLFCFILRIVMWIRTDQKRAFFKARSRPFAPNVLRGSKCLVAVIDAIHHFLPISTGNMATEGVRWAIHQHMSGTDLSLKI